MTVVLNVYLLNTSYYHCITFSSSNQANNQYVLHQFTLQGKENETALLHVKYCHNLKYFDLFKRNL